MLQFKRNLCEQLTYNIDSVDSDDENGNIAASGDDDDGDDVPKRKKNKTELDSIRLSGRDHFPFKSLGSDNKSARARCKVCGVRGTIECSKCGVFLCCNLKKNQTTCWSDFHSIKDYKIKN